MIRDGSLVRLLRDRTPFVAWALLLCWCGVGSAADAPLADAAEKADWPRVRSLLQARAGAKVDATDRKSQTALMWAADEGHAAVVELLIKAGADVRARLKSGFTPLLFAAREGRLEAVRALLKAGVDPNEAIQTANRVG